MKKRVIILLIGYCLLYPVKSGKGQFVDPAASAAASQTAVNTGAMLTQMTTMAALIEKMEKAQKVVKKSLEFIDKAEEIKRAARLMELIDATVCSMQEYQFYLQFAIKYDCIVHFDFELINSKFSYTTNIINIAVTAGNLLSSGERVNSLKDAIELLEGAMAKTEDFNEQMRNNVNRMLVNNYMDAQMKGLSTVSRY